jgi:Right handed beta helix region
MRTVGPPLALLAVVLPMVLHMTRFELADFAGWRRSFYVSPQGNDDLDGLSPGRAWRTLHPLASVTMRPGDQILLAGGGRFSGTIRLRARDAGNPSAPVIIGSYGAGRATLVASDESGISVYDTAGVEIRNLAIVGGPGSLTAGGGIKLYSDLPGNRKLDHVAISDVEVTGFKNGIEIGGGRGATGFRDVRISDSALHGNRDAGVTSYGPAFDAAAPSYAHDSVLVSDVQVFDNLGNPDDRRTNTGNGIALGSVRGAVVEGSTAHDNGALCDALSGPVGIWAYDSTAVVFQHNVSYRNRTGGRTDGGGFDFDQNVSASVMQYNLSYQNDGAGFFLFSDRPNRAQTGNVIRFNISSDDTRKSEDYGAFEVAGPIYDAQIYHNTVVLGPNDAVHPPTLLVRGKPSGLALRNNVFIATAPGTAVVVTDPVDTSQVLMQGNDVLTAPRWRVVWGGQAFASLADWRAGTGQESAGGSDAGTDTGTDADPSFALAGTPAAVGPARAVGFVPAAGSPLVGRGVDLRALGIDPGPVDYFGRPLVSPPTIGAAQPAP